jgi:hypothetical protein
MDIGKGGIDQLGGVEIDCALPLGDKLKCIQEAVANCWKAGPNLPGRHQRRLIREKANQAPEGFSHKPQEKQQSRKQKGPKKDCANNWGKSECSFQEKGGGKCSSGDREEQKEPPRRFKSVLPSSNLVKTLEKTLISLQLHASTLSVSAPKP